MWNKGSLDYPADAAQVRDLIRQMLQSQVDYGSHIDQGGGMGSADLWATFGGVEYVITVQRPRDSGIPIPKLTEEEQDEIRRQQEELRRLVKEGKVQLIIPPKGA
jgi:hypothetical protein